MSVPQLWLVGPRDAPELAAAVRWLLVRAECRAIADSRGAAEAAMQAPKQRGASDPEFVVLCETRPGQIRACDVAVIARAFPLARLVALCGAWCDGEPRTTRPWPGVTRIHWHEGQARLAGELGPLHGCLRLPPTTTEVDRVLRQFEAPLPAGPALLIGVVSKSRATFEAIAQALAIAGHHAVGIVPRCAPAITQMDALVIDAGGNVVAAIDEVDLLRSRFGPQPAAILCDFPRPEDVESVASLLQAALLSKPFRVADLIASLGGSAESRPSAGAPPAIAAA